jgi:hypothetical protein
MSTYYFVAFESRSKADALVKTVSNVILKDVHPVIWLANPPDAYKEYWVGVFAFLVRDFRRCGHGRRQVYPNRRPG